MAYYGAMQCLSSFRTLTAFSLIILLGKMKGIAFVKDPDGYWIEILNGENLVKVTKEFSS